MDLAAARQIFAAAEALDAGRFYGASTGLALGKGLIYPDVPFPQYNDQDRVFDTLYGPVLVLTHECDVDAENERPFNEDVLVVPIIPLDALLDEMAASGMSHDAQYQFLSNLSARNISRLVYLPPCEYFANGGAIFLNRITATHVQEFAEPSADSCRALSGYGMRDITWAIENHLRPKAERLALEPFA